MTDYDRILARILDLKIVGGRRSRAHQRVVDAMSAERDRDKEWRVIHEDVIEMLRARPELKGREIDGRIFLDGTEGLWTMVHGELTEVTPIDLAADPAEPEPVAADLTPEKVAELRALADQLREAERPKPLDGLPWLLGPIGEAAADTPEASFATEWQMRAEPPTDEPDHIPPATFAWTESGFKAREAARKFGAGAEYVPPAFDWRSPGAAPLPAVAERVAEHLGKALLAGVPPIGAKAAERAGT